MITAKAILSSFLLPPLNLILIGLGGLLLLRINRAIAFFLCGLSVFLNVLLSTNIGALLLVAPLENITSPLPSTVDTGAQAIVILGGENLNNAPEYGATTIPGLTQYARIRYGAKLHRETGLPILTSGASDVIEKVLRNDFGIPVRWIETSSRDTAENAKFAAEILQPVGIHSVLLVTDAIHMPRSYAIFSKFGLNVIPAPTYFYSRNPINYRDFIPSGEALGRSHYAMREWLGIGWYYLMHFD